MELVPDNYFERLDPAAAFGRRAPLEVDVGCGEGAFLTSVAGRFPERNFLGIERLLGRVRKTCRRAAHRRLENVRVLRLESLYAVCHLLPPESVSVFHVSFPDPWPKRKHQRRRLVQHAFLDALRDALLPGGEVRLTTDDAGYFEHMRRIGLARPDFQAVPWIEEPDYPQTDFEKGYRALGLPIYRLLLRKI
jgi:tRNA (guanine-N7-)-methyltransferase